MLSDSAKKFLLRAARCSIESAVRTGRPSLLTTEEPSLLAPRAVFVTLHRGEELRGCMGYLEPTKPLFETVQNVAASAAHDDPRFHAVTGEELPEIRIEISILSPMTRVRAVEEIEVGKHGLLLEHGRCRGLLLPQVAVEHGWDRTTFLVQVARKAGLPPAAWQEREAGIFTFTAEVFHEEKATAPPATGAVSHSR